MNLYDESSRAHLEDPAREIEGLGWPFACIFPFSVNVPRQDSYEVFVEGGEPKILTTEQVEDFVEILVIQ